MPSGSRPPSRPGPGPGRGRSRARSRPRPAGSDPEIGTRPALEGQQVRAESGDITTDRARPPDRGRRASLTTRAIALAVVLLILTISYASSLRIYFAQAEKISATRAEIVERQGTISALRDKLELVERSGLRPVAGPGPAGLGGPRRDRLPGHRSGRKAARRGSPDQSGQRPHRRDAGRLVAEVARLRVRCRSSRGGGADQGALAEADHRKDHPESPAQSECVLLRALTCLSCDRATRRSRSPA